MCTKQLCKNDIASKDAGYWLESLKSRLQVFFTISQHILQSITFFFFVSGTFAASGLKTNIFNKNFAKPCLEKN